ncbi:MAG: hypothetical protein H8D78_03980 [Chloroflexi bacterium]|nr:hypothetical protein [Chloroflexota bacterium]
MNKKQWQKPELIVLVRSKPEEAVLTACKGAAMPGADAVAQRNCVTVFGCPGCLLEMAS